MIGITGINHKSAPVEVREKLSFNEEEIVLFLERLTSETGVKEAVLLSTCNRTEVCFNLPGDDHNAEKIVKALLASKNIDLEIKKYFYFYYDSHAVKHLLEVSAGLDSMVLGENQILGQVKDAYRISSTRNYTDTVLNRLFHKAFEAGKKVRTETGVNEGASSVSYAAVELAGKIFGRIGSTPILLIGAGETGELVLQSLIERGSTNIHVTNRTFGRAESLAKKYKARVVPFENLREYLAKCDIILSSTSAPYPIITTPLMKEVMKERKNRTGFLIDLSVPRDIEDGVRDIENLFLYNIDDLEEVVAHNFEKRKKEIEKARKIIEKIKMDFITWFTSLNLAPTIEALKEKFDLITGKELDNIKHKIEENEYRKVSEFANFLKGKYLGLIIKNFKNISSNGRDLQYIEFINKLFELEVKSDKPGEHG